MKEVGFDPPNYLAVAYLGSLDDPEVKKIVAEIKTRELEGFNRQLRDRCDKLMKDSILPDDRA